MFTSGTGLGLTCAWPPEVPLTAGAILLAASLVCQSVRKPAAASVATITLLLAVACTAWSHAAGQTQSRAPSVTSLIGSPTAGVGIIGVLEDEPVIAEAVTNGVLWKAPVAAERIRLSRDEFWQPVEGTVWVRFRLPAAFNRPCYGEQWAFSGHLTAGTNASVRGANPPPAFMSAGRSSCRILRGKGSALIAYALEARAKAQSILVHGISRFPEESAILNSLLLGIRGQMPREVYQAFANTSTLHVFAISGSHVVILAGFVVLALSAAGIPRTRWILVLAPVLLLYTVMTGLQSSAVRACIMGILFWSGPLLGRKPDLYSSLGAAAILLLAWAPADLLDAGFLLSFVAVLGLAMFTPLFAHPFLRRLRKDPLLLEPDPKWKQSLRRAASELVTLAAMTLAASLVSAPLTALYFGSIAPIGLVGNLLAIPLSSLIILTGALSLTLGSCAWVLADIFNHANVGLACLLNRFIGFLSSIPGGHWNIAPPPLWMVLSGYAALLVIRFAVWIYMETEAKRQAMTETE